ncbi:hypothetical protein IP92_05790 [Pseudoduganella flava]|uniref:Uncharacterized protein n=1 Tax=Pseudoduganella flava TaxID=871742 RepID=A0A562P9R8_9BURK|nr:hypothetical protein [Pseudoduganella flava]QGZ38034.1 hypothetical protein GO485_02540 [Pseudoduganella flava]TWI40970.1 hypothetical protein IP92_05790 [Pseudoduganella flava]
MAERGTTRSRADATTAARVEDGLKIGEADGIHPALEFMRKAGVPREIALRVLCAPQFHRRGERRRNPR